MIRAVLLGCCLLISAGAAGPLDAQTARSREAAKARTYRVSEGETPFAIAWRLGLPWAEIAAANRLDPAAPVRPGQLLTIPQARIARPLSSATAPRFAWPLDGAVRRGFAASQRGRHDCVDLATSRGTPVHAAAAGRVIFAGEETRQFGQLVVIDHGGGWHSAYGFLERIAVREGERVPVGARIGSAGTTGPARGEELHFEIRRDNRPVDPLPLLGKR